MAGLSDPLRYKRYWGQFSGDNDNNREIQTYDDMMAEYSGIYGIPIAYYTINVDDYKNGIDPITGESASPKWDRKYDLTAMTEQWTQELQRFSVFDLEGIDEMTLYIHRSTFDKQIGWRSGETPVQMPNITPRPVGPNPGGYGPIAKDMIFTPHNGFVYEVITGGLHFLESNAQHFGHKFWYKVTLRQREISAPTIGTGEQFGAGPSGTVPLDPKYQGNPQFILPTPSCEDLTSAFTQTNTLPPTGDNADACGRVSYVTTGSSEGPSNGQTPEDLNLPDGRVASKYQIQPPAPQAAKGTNKEVQAVADETVSPQNNLVAGKTTRPVSRDSSGNVIYTDDGSQVSSFSDDYRRFVDKEKYGPTGRVLHNKRDLWGEW